MSDTPAVPYEWHHVAYSSSRPKHEPVPTSTRPVGVANLLRSTCKECGEKITGSPRKP